MAIALTPLADPRLLLRSEVERDERALREAVAGLERHVRDGLSLGRLAAEHPWVWVIGGFVLGAWVGARVRRTR